MIFSIWNMAEGKLGQIVRRFQEDRVTVYAAQASFYITLSAIPFLMLMVTLIGHFPFIEEDKVIGLVSSYLPEWAHETALTLIEEVFRRNGVPIISITAVSLLWISSRGFKSIGQGVRNVYRTQDRIGYFRNIFLSLLFTVGFVLLLIIIVAAMIFGETLFERIVFLEKCIYFVVQISRILSFLLLTAVFTISFHFMTGHDLTLREHLPGAAFAAAGWIVFSTLYSFYIEHIASYSYVYGSMAAVVLLILWAYFCMLILLAGAELNMLLLAREKRKRKNEKE